MGCTQNPRIFFKVITSSHGDQHQFWLGGAKKASHMEKKVAKSPTQGKKAPHIRRKHSKKGVQGGEKIIKKAAKR